MKAKFNLKHITYLLLALSMACSCTWHKSEELFRETGYPEEMERIIVANCAVSGCHNDKSKEAAAGLSLETWDRMFEGSRAGATVIPFRSDFSTLFYYINTDSALGLSLLPRMPIGRPPLSKDEILAVKNWIDQGAPNKQGHVKFSDNSDRKKFYVANQGCDVVTVFDAESMLAMRYVTVGNSPTTESPHMVKVSLDNRYWYTVFLASNFFQAHSVEDNSLVGQVEIGPGQWNTFSLSSDGQMAYAIDFSGGNIAMINLSTMTSRTINGFVSPHGSVLNPTNDTLYVVRQAESALYKIPVNAPENFESVDLVQSFPAPAELLPHEIMFSPDGSKYFVTCQHTNELRVVQSSNDSVIAAIPVGIFPQEMAVSEVHPYLFVSCMEDNNLNPNEKSSIAIIDYRTNQFVKKVYAGYQSHGIAVDDKSNRVYISNRNLSSNGPAPHHSSVCGGRNGNVTAIDLSTLEIIPGFKAEVSVDPYGVGIMH